MRLDYKRGMLIRAALFCLVLGIGGFLIALTPHEGKRGLVGLAVALLGPKGAQMLTGVLSLLLMLGGLRLIWLTFDEALAVAIGPEGIIVRSPYYSGLLPWSAVDHVESRIVGGWGKHPSLVIRRADHPGPLLWLAGLGDKLVVQQRLLDADAHAVRLWIEATRTRGRTGAMRPEGGIGMPPGGGFGRRR